MQFSRFVGIIDLGVATVVLVTLALPAREMYAGSAHGGSDAERFGLALAEARTIAHPQDGAAIDDLSRRLAAAGETDWAIETAVRGAARARQSPTRWRALLAASVALAGRNDAVPALDYAHRALAACKDHEAACPSWEKSRMTLYQDQLEAGVASGIDPRRDPEGFRMAGERALHRIHVGGHDVERGAPPSGPGSNGPDRPSP
ncbi:MAG: hypothetical protein E6J90_25395 [Deltaproteobacteria bacterium]|nr:MAG: hypothetical protein E6J90_25395 [Deltaproteobacteria bacterium]TMQ16645.1 MAG: hypothetical protein E6J91_11430 [Deltaproteobacteria bacterium]